jgi:recombinational DNA repair protein (RecF pathway)
MNEYVTEGIVLNVRNQRETDRTADIFTRQLGRVDVKVTGGRKPLSKLTPHLDVLSLVKLRLVEKNQIIVVDALSEENFGGGKFVPAVRAHALTLLNLLRFLLPQAEPDERLWHYLVKGFRAGAWRTKDVLRILGYAPEEASCALCGRRPVASFHLKSQEFFCDRCSAKAPQNELIWL